MTRSDATWMTLRAGLRDLFLQEHHRPYTMFNRYPSPEQQTPQMITLIGQQTKTLVMRKLRLGNPTQNRTRGEAHLLADFDSFKNESPMIFADCELHNASTIAKVGPERLLGDVRCRPLTWHREPTRALDSKTMAHLVYSKLMAPFSTVICFFAADLGGLPGVAEILALWLVNFSNRPVDLPQGTYPQVLILTEGYGTNIFDEREATTSFMLEVGKETEKQHGILAGQKGRLKKAELDRLLTAQFGGMRVVSFPSLDASSRSWKPLRSRILQDSNELQVRRIDAHVAFSARHFEAFLGLASDHFSNDITSPFSFIRGSRMQNPQPPNLGTHVATFLKQVQLSQVLNFAVPVIASAFVQESYPPGMHGFHPSLVFRHFFYQLCIQLDPFRGEDRYARPSTPQFANAIEVAFCQYAFETIAQFPSDPSNHKNVLARFNDIWTSMKSNTSCFACLSRSPEHTLVCRHAICSPCAIGLGRSSDGDPWVFWIDNCPLCGEPDGVKITQKPDTAGVRAIIAEGGGVRGVVPLPFLMELEASIDLPMGIQEHFDIAFGSSAGALIILGLFSNRWPAAECLRQFQSLSTLAFRKRKYFGLPLAPFGKLRGILDFLRGFATDSKYGSDGITAGLISAFGETQTLFESRCGGAKVAVVAATTSDSSTCIFSNYNGPERRHSSGYKIVRPEESRREFSVWQAARASSAAPPYFKSFNGYHDGGLGGHNNPIHLALWEQDAIWSREKKEPDIVLSLGTGYRRAPESESESPRKQSFFRTRCVPRLFRSFLNFFVGETRWQELLMSLAPGVRSRYHRMNIEFFGDEPELDDLQAMPNMLQQAKFQALSNDDVRNCADNMLASLFYIKLNGLPTFDRDLFVCRGQILCRLGPSHQALRPLAARMYEASSHFYLAFDQKLPCLDEEDLNSLQYGAPFCCNIIFKVVSLDDFVDIKIDGITKRPRRISNCPYKITTLIKDQELDCAFGGRKGRKRMQPDMHQVVPKRVKFKY